MNKEEIAQWVIDNRYPKNEQSKMSDAEMYHTLIDKLTPPQQTVSAPERTAKEEAETLINQYIAFAHLQRNMAIEVAKLDTYNTITALKSANVSTVWHEEVLTILKGM